MKKSMSRQHAAGAVIMVVLTVTPFVAANAQSTQREPLGWSYARQSQSANISEAGGGPGGRLEACSEELGKYCIDKKPAGRACLEANKDSLSARCKARLAALPTGGGGEEGGIRIPPCAHSVACASTLGGTKVTLERVEWKQTMGYTFAYPFRCRSTTNGGGGVSGVGVDSKGNLWAFQRNAPGQPQLFEFDPDHKLIRTVGEDVIGHQYKPHGIAVDRDRTMSGSAMPSGSTVMKIAAEGKLL